MSFLAKLGQTCIGHGEIAQAGECCEGLTAWSYDSNTGLPYGGFGCWWAECAPEGQYSGPGGLDLGKCCSGLVSIDGKCQKPPSGATPLPSPIPVPGEGGGFFGIPTEYLMYGGIALVLLLMTGGKKR